MPLELLKDFCRAALGLKVGKSISLVKVIRQGTCYLAQNYGQIYNPCEGVLVLMRLSLPLSQGVTLH